MKKYVINLQAMRIVCFKVALIIGLLAITEFIGKAQTNPQPDPPIVRGMGGRLADAQKIKQYGGNVIRVWLGRSGDLEKEMLVMRELGMKAVVVGGMGHFDYTDPQFEARFIQTWKDLATRLLPYRDVIWGYDLINEPMDKSQVPLAPKEWRGMAIRITEAIRTIDDSTWIIYEVGPGERATGFVNLEPLPDKRTIYGFHYYFPHEFTHAGVKSGGLAGKYTNINVSYPTKINDIMKTDGWIVDLHNVPIEKCTEWNKDFQKLVFKPVLDFQKKYNVPIYIGEFSTVSWGNVDMSIRWLREAIEIFEENGWSWSYFMYNGWSGWDPEKPEGPEHYWEQGDVPAPKPSATETQRTRLLKEAFKKNLE